MIWRKITAILAGLVVAGLLIALVEFLGRLMYPIPEGLDYKNPEDLQLIMKSMKFGAFFMVILSYIVGSFGGAWVAAKIGPEYPVTSALIIGGLLMVSGFINLVSIPHPIWFWVASSSVYLPFSWLAGSLVKKPNK